MSYIFLIFVAQDSKSVDKDSKSVDKVNTHCSCYRSAIGIIGSIGRIQADLSQNIDMAVLTSTYNLILYYSQLHWFP